jgi:hypothetical protein
VPGCHEMHRRTGAATEGAGVAATLALQILDPLGVIDSTSQTQIFTTEETTLIAQLTVSALHDSPVDRTNIWLTISREAGIRPMFAPTRYPVPPPQYRQ